ncbi:MAG: 23S rRNA (adenine(2503)-C(2))-methyltransferase RlmN [Eubacteriales bacterium]|nr:23S rRNA (adenine(2503)-C(2))-methyltransferase RlmN [Eubacteriales bacterium]
MENRKDICELNIEELRALIKEKGQPKFRADQLYGWLHKQKVKSFEEMKNIPAALKNLLSEEYYITVMEPEDILISRLDGTRKYVFALFDGNVIEAVLMKYKHGNSVCISSQVGCRMGCRFCASTLDGCVRNLTAAEMLSEVYRIESDLGERISNIVIMGSGEPLDNYDEVLRFLHMITDPDGLNISARNITLSTCGLVPEIRRLSKEELPITLALSLHAPNQAKREEIMPIAKKYELSEVLSACADYVRDTGRRISFEYSVVKGVNDSKEEAEELSRLLRDFKGVFHVNIIPVNPIEEREYESPDRDAVLSFKDILERNKINATIRREMGRDISSACGQLRRRHLKNANTITD